MRPDKRLLGITAEYNPFHAGHAYHLRESLARTGAEHAVVVMSGFFVQRGEPAVYDPYLRARMALEAGASAVFLLPAAASCASAEEFAGTAVGMLASLGCGWISCGTETEDREALLRAAKLLEQEPEQYRESLKASLKEGLNFPAAREAALEEAAGAETARLLRGPNNILAVEYLKAVLKNGYGMEPVFIRRRGSGHDRAGTDGDCPSARALREELLRRKAPGALSPDDILPFLQAVLDRLVHEGADLTVFRDVSPEISVRLQRADLREADWETLVRSLKTRNYTYTRIARCLLHILLDIRRVPESAKPAEKTVPAAGRMPQLIGFRRDREDVLGMLDCGIVSKPADHREALAQEAYAAQVYNAAYYSRFREKLPDFFSRQIVIV